jgi:hypothetical protein
MRAGLTAQVTCFEDILSPELGPVVQVEAALTVAPTSTCARLPVMIPHVPTVFGHELASVVTAVNVRSR